MPFFLDGNPTTSEISEAVNYLLSNFTTGSSINPDNGQIKGPGGVIVGYLYKYMAVKYADSYDGSTGFSNTPTNKQYYGLRNNDSATESDNPADYVWYEAADGFGTLKFLWYITTGGRQIQFAVSMTAPDSGWLVDPGTSIDLDLVTSSTTPILAESFFSYFTPSILQVPRSGNPLVPSFTGVAPQLYSTNGGTVVPFVDAQTDSAVNFVNNTWRIGNSSTTGYGDISYTNITIGSPTDGGDFAIWPNPTAMSSSPAYISVPVRYKDSTGGVTQASVATLQLLFIDPGPAGQNSPYIDISGYTGFVVNAGGLYTPSTATLSAITTAVTAPSYSWSITNATPTSSTNSSVVITPNSSAPYIEVTLTVNGSNLLSPLSKTIRMPVTYDGATGQAGQNGLMSAFPTIYIWTGSSAAPVRPSTTSTYTWADGSYTAPSGWSTTAPSNTTAGNYLWSITIPLNVSATTLTSTLDWTNTVYPIRCIAYNGSNGNDGNSARAMFLTASSQTFTYNAAGSAEPSSQTITFTANPQNLTGTTVFTATNYNASNTPIGSPTLGGSGNTRTLAVGDFGVADHCVVTASLSGYTDTVTIIRVQDGQNSLSGYLTNESVTVQTDSTGGGGVYSSAGGTFKVFYGLTDVTTSCSFSASNSAGLSLTINSTTGVYTVTGLSSAQATSTMTATYLGTTITKVYTIAKSYAGNTGSSGSSTFLVSRVANDSSPPTDAECIAAIGRTPVPGDIVTVSYNNYNNAVVYRYTNTWITQVTYITGSLIVQNTITADKLQVNTLSAISANIGNITAGDLKLGSNPEISGTTMTGSGAHLYNDGRMVLGNSTQNLVWDGSNLNIRGDIVAYGNLNGSAIGQIIAGSFNFVPKTATGAGTFVVPTDVYKIKVTCIGGGGGGVGAINTGGAGGAGSCIKVFAVTPGQSYSYFVGAGGSGGGNGQDTTFSGNGINMVAGKGFGAPAGAYNGGAGGTASGGDLNMNGNRGSDYTLPNGGAAPFIGVAGSYPAGSASANSGGGGASSFGSGGSGGSGLIIIEY